MTDATTLGQYLRAARKDKKLTQEAVARVVGIDTSYLSKIETDSVEHTPSVKTLAALAEALELDELELIDRADKMPPAMRNLAATPAALRFLRRASAEIDSPEGWEALHRFLDEQQRKEP